MHRKISKSVVISVSHGKDLFDTSSPFFCIIWAHQCLDDHFTEGMPCWALDGWQNGINYCLILLLNLLQRIKDISWTFYPTMFDLDIEPTLHTNDVFDYEPQVLKVFPVRPCLETHIRQSLFTVVSHLEWLSGTISRRAKSTGSSPVLIACVIRYP